jgi:hypothetical protein
LTVSFSLHEEYTSEIGNKAYVLIQTPEALRDTDVPDPEEPTVYRINSVARQAQYITVSTQMAYNGIPNTKFVYANGAVPTDWVFIPVGESADGNPIVNIVSAADSADPGWALKITHDIYSGGNYAGAAAPSAAIVWVCSAPLEDDASFKWEIELLDNGAWLIKSRDSFFSQPHYLNLTGDQTDPFELGGRPTYKINASSTNRESSLSWWYLNGQHDMVTVEFRNPYNKKNLLRSVTLPKGRVEDLSGMPELGFENIIKLDETRFIPEEISLNVGWLENDQPVTNDDLKNWEFDETTILYANLSYEDVLINAGDTDINLWLAEADNYYGPPGNGVYVNGAPTDQEGSARYWRFEYVENGYFAIYSLDRDVALRITNDQYLNHTDKVVNVKASSFEDENDAYLWRFEPVNSKDAATYGALEGTFMGYKVINKEYPYYALALGTESYEKSSGSYYVAGVPSEDEEFYYPNKRGYWFIGSDSIGKKLTVRFFYPGPDEDIELAGPYYVDYGANLGAAIKVGLTPGDYNELPADFDRLSNYIKTPSEDSWIDGGWYKKGGNPADAKDADNITVTENLNLVPLFGIHDRTFELKLGGSDVPSGYDTFIKNVKFKLAEIDEDGNAFYYITNKEGLALMRVDGYVKPAVATDTTPYTKEQKNNTDFYEFDANNYERFLWHPFVIDTNIGYIQSYEPNWYLMVDSGGKDFVSFNVKANDKYKGLNSNISVQEAYWMAQRLSGFPK